MLRIDKVWITSGMKQELYKAHRTKEMMKHCKRRYGWTRRVYNLVDSGAIRRARSKQSQTRRVQTSKLMHEWLPVMKMRKHVTGLSQCPGYSHPVEDIKHLFRCPHRLMEKRRNEALKLV